MTSYSEFIQTKTPRVEDCGIPDFDPNPMLYPFQRDIVRWAVKRGRAAIFADCGMGKTLMQLEWARAFAGRVLIVAPIAVGQQTINEGRRIGLDVRRALDGSECLGDGYWITNYERIHKFVGVPFDAIVLDESSILKSVDGKTRAMLLADFTSIPRRLCCTATPAPNDIAELANHAEFLGIMARTEMLATYFVHDSDGAARTGWRLKGWSADAMFRWMASWAAYVRKPSDLGYDDGAFRLPELHINDESVRTEWKQEGMLFAADLGGVGSRTAVRKDTMALRLERAAGIIKDSADQWLVWCGLNDEGRELARALGSDCVLVEGQDSEDEKIAAEARWRAGGVRVLISKPTIFGFGMNWQHCHRMLFLGLGDSYEQYYQAIRRCWRFGQQHPVDVRIVISDVEGAIAANVRRKEHDANNMADAVVGAMRENQLESIRGVKGRMDYMTDEQGVDGEWRLMLGDSIERVKEIPDASVGLSVFSPPFASLYTYSASERDLGNCKDYDEFFRHFGYLIPEILRVTMPGRRCCVHVQQVSTTKVTHGVIGWRDFRADTVREFIGAGWVYDGEVVIDKDPQAQAIRTKSKQLLFVQKERDAAWLRPAMADYILLFRHPGDNPEPVQPGEDVNNEDWILWARPIWYGIRESDTLQVAQARDDQDEKHVCPLQLGTIERCVRLWSNRGDVVFSPFAGIGSEGYVALQQGRKFIGCELKPSYWRVACRNLRLANAQADLFAVTE